MKLLIVIFLTFSVSFADDLTFSQNTSMKIEEAKLYLEGKRVTKDYSRAKIIFKNICDNGGAKACNYVGILYLSGKGVRKNYQKAKEYFSLSCSLGYNVACYNQDVI